MASGENLYVDPSALLKLYLQEPESRAMAAWRSRLLAPLIITHHGRVELINAIGLAAYRGAIHENVFHRALAVLDEDFEEGRYLQTDLLWRATLKRAADLARRFTRTLGCRSLDVVHVASAVELSLPVFVTFDARQAELARAARLRVVKPA